MSWAGPPPARFEEARDKVAGFLNAGSRQEVVFGRQATEALNRVASGTAASSSARAM
jgi:selenocysteine lyase/cysteine desulfurase